MELNLSQIVERIQKDLTASNVIGTAGNTLLSRQNLDAYLVKLTDRETPARDLFGRIAGSGNAVSFNRRKALNSAQNPTDAYYADNGLPVTITAQYDQISFPYTRIGFTGGVSGFAEAAGQSYGDLYLEAVETTTKAVVHAEEWSIFHGNPTFTNPNGQTPFAGFDYLLSTNVINLNGASLGTDTTQLDKMIKLLKWQGLPAGAGLTIFCSFGMQAQINALLAKVGDVRINFVNTDGLTVGANAPFYQSTAGKLPIIGDYFINPGGANPYPYDSYNGSSTSSTGATTSNIYFIATKYVKMNDLKALGRTELGIVKDGIEFFVNEYTVMELWAEPWCGIIKNVLETF